MNTNNKSETGRDGNLLTGILCAVSVVTISAPVFSLVFNTNEPDPYADLNGILVRAEGDSPAVNVSRTSSTYIKRTSVDSDKTGFVYQFEDDSVENHSQFSFAELEQFSISDQISELTPPAITLPAAQASGKVAKIVPSQPKKIDIDANTMSGDYQSADDFVNSLNGPATAANLNLTAAN